MMLMDSKQSEMIIGTLGHVDHGKTTLTRALTGVWTDTHSESVKRSMTIKLGYADVVVRHCTNASCSGTKGYTISEKCLVCGGKTEQARRISILDAPGHETLMATAIAGSNIIDAVLFVISAAEKCPMPQTKEHLMLINLLDIKKAIIVQTKVDVVGHDAAKEHYQQIKAFIKGSVIENAPIVPVIASKNINIDVILQMLAEMPLPQRDVDSDPIMYAARSFDVNRPGAEIAKLNGGVVGGSIIRGRLKVGDEIEISPGIASKNADKQKASSYTPIRTKVEALSASAGHLDEAIAGGLIAIGTSLDPAITKADGLVGSIVGKAGKVPKPVISITLSMHVMERDDVPKQGFRENEPLILGIGTATVGGFVSAVKKNSIGVTLKRPVCIDKDSKISILRNFSQRWRLAGYGTLAK